MRRLLSLVPGVGRRGGPMLVPPAAPVKARYPAVSDEGSDHDAVRPFLQMSVGVVIQHL